MKHLKCLRQYYDRFESVPSVTIAFEIVEAKLGTRPA